MLIPIYFNDKLGFEQFMANIQANNPCESMPVQALEDFLQLNI